MLMVGVREFVCGAPFSRAAEMCSARGLLAGRKILENAQSMSSSRRDSIVTVVARQPTSLLYT
jgi:hypothetical protein